MRRERTEADRWLAALLVALALGIAAAASLGPLVLDRMSYRTSDTTLNQLTGADAAALAVVAPVALVAAFLVLRGHPTAAYLAVGVAGFALYTYAQVVIGQEYLREPGNVERFFPLLLAVFVVAEATLVLAWRRLPPEPPAMSRRLVRVISWCLLGVAFFLVGGLHLPTLVTAWEDPQSLTQYASSPTPFWMVKLMDLGIVVPLAVATGVALLRGSVAARRLAGPLLTGFTFLGASVTAMALVMLAEGDPDGSVGLAAGFGAFTLAFGALTTLLLRAVSRTETAPARPAAG